MLERGNEVIISRPSSDLGELLRPMSSLDSSYCIDGINGCQFLVSSYSLFTKWTEADVEIWILRGSRRKIPSGRTPHARLATHPRVILT